MTIKKGSEMITFEKEGMKDALQGTEQWFSDDHSPRFWLGRDFPVRFRHGKFDFSFHGKEWNSISLDNNKLKVKKGVRLR